MLNDTVAHQLKDLNAEPGDYIRIKKADQIFQGILLPHHTFSRPDVVTVKLPNGYNIGLMVEEGTEIDLIQK
jgi:glutamyl-tRNA(Gln) amidotransferase subunit D